MTTSATVAATPTAEDDGPLDVLTAGRGQDTPDEASIVSMLDRCAAGEVDALSDLYDATAALVYRLSLMVLRDEGRAASNTRHTYRTVWEHAARYDRSLQGSALSWLVTVAYTRARSATA